MTTRLFCTVSGLSKICSSSWQNLRTFSGRFHALARMFWRYFESGICSVSSMLEIIQPFVSEVNFVTNFEKFARKLGFTAVLLSPSPIFLIASAFRFASTDGSWVLLIREFCMLVMKSRLLDVILMLSSFRTCSLIFLASVNGLWSGSTQSLIISSVLQLQ